MTKKANFAPHLERSTFVTEWTSLGVNCDECEYYAEQVCKAIILIVYNTSTYEDEVTGLINVLLSPNLNASGESFGHSTAVGAEKWVREDEVQESC